MEREARVRRAMRAAVLLLASALFLACAAPATAATLTVLTTTNSLQTLESATPGSLSPPIAITGLVAGETVTAIDFRTGNGRLYGVALTDAGSVQLYGIDASTGAATPVGAPFSSPFGLGDTIFGLDIDFDPSADQLRFVTIWNDHRRIDPDSGAATPLPPLAYLPGDPNAAETPFVPALAYSPSFPGATSPTAFGYEGFFDDAARLGSLGGSPVAPDTGQMFTYNVSPGVGTFGQRYGLDVAPDGAAFLFARSTTGMTDLSRLFAYDLAAGTVSEIGLIGDGSDVIADIATQPVSNAVRFSSAAFSGTEGTAVTVGLTRSNTIGTATVDVGAGVGSPDYSGLPRTAVFANGSATATVQVQLRDDGAVEPDEQVALVLSNPRGGRATLMDPATASLTIHDRVAVPAAVPRCAGKRATIVGTPGSDVLGGTRGDDVIAGRGGNDVVKAGRGDDTVCGGAGNDALAGKAGDDRVKGQAGNDRASGGAGNDRVDGGAGEDRLLGGPGKDRLAGRRGRDSLRGGPGRDRLRGGPGRDVQRQ